jgi:uncharacterized low-complexity protein
MTKLSSLTPIATFLALSVAATTVQASPDVTSSHKAPSATKTADAKCGEGKCGGSASKTKKAADAKCGEGKCGGSASKKEKTADAKCGEGKCGGKK